MKIITQNILKFIKNTKVFSNEFNSSIEILSRKLLEQSLLDYKIDFESIVNDILNNCYSQFINIIKYMIINMDEEFFNSDERKKNYMSKGKYSRTILFLFGEITFERYYYVNKHTKKDGFFFIDKSFSLPKKYSLSNDVKNKLFYFVSELGSYSKAGKYLGEYINKNSYLDSNFKYISRATVFNYVKNAEFNYSFLPKHRKVENIFIELDEHYISTQNYIRKNIKSNKIMVKVAKIYSNKDCGIYSDRFIIIDNFKHSFMDILYDYVSSEYDLDFVSNIYILGDGANWIKSCKDLFDKNKSIFILDKFHAFQSVVRLVSSKDKFAYDFVSSFIFNNDLKTFKIWYQLYSNENNHRINSIDKFYKYLINQWAAIQRAINSNVSCSMEGCISSSVADVFTSRPKAFSLKLLSNRLMLRAFYRNSFGDENTFYNFLKSSNNNYNSDSTIYYDNLDFSIFDYLYKDETYKFNFNINTFRE